MKKLDSSYIKFIEQLASIVNDSNLDEIEFKEQETSIKIIRNKPSVAAAQIVSPAHLHSALPSHNQAPVTTSNVIENTETNYADNPNTVLSPMVGVIYTSKDPDSDPYISEGSTVNQGDTIFLIEAMKVFNPIKAPKSGKVTKILVGNSQTVEFNEPLVVIE